MKVTRKMLLWIIVALGVLIIAYGLIRQFTGFGLSEDMEKYFMDGVIIAALGLFMYNRKMLRDERMAREAALRAEEEPEEEVSPENENLSHWERYKKNPEEVQESEEDMYEDEDDYEEEDDDNENENNV